MTRADGNGERRLPKLAKQPGISVCLLKLEWDVVEKIVGDAADSSRPGSDAAFNIWRKLSAQLKRASSRSRRS